ncbi:MAG: hypothetical protein IJO40_13055 [Thermoguttaceae bacterium]|nr:hypothetical protein [Thermoguttaceae bacterium]
MRVTKRGRVAETARETIKTAEGRTGNAPTRSPDDPTLPFYPICGGVKGGPGAFFERRRAKRRGVRAAGREFDPTFGARASGGASTGV